MPKSRENQQRGNPFCTHPIATAPPVCYNNQAPKGAKEGVFQPNINFEIVALLAKEQAKMIRPSKALSNHSVSEVFNTILYTFLRGISTEKGIAILDRYLLKYKQKQLD